MGHTDLHEKAPDRLKENVAARNLRNLILKYPRYYKWGLVRD